MSVQLVRLVGVDELHPRESGLGNMVELREGADECLGCRVIDGPCIGHLCPSCGMCERACAVLECPQLAVVVE